MNNLSLILSYSKKEISLYNREQNKSIRGSWLYNLAKELHPYQIDEHIKLYGFDESYRIEIQVSLSLFELLKKSQLFIQKAENLRRIRTLRTGSTHVLEYLCYPISDFDNDFDNPNKRLITERHKLLCELK